MRRRLLVEVMVAGAAFTAAAVSTGGPTTAQTNEARRQGPVAVIALPMVGGDSGSKFGVGPPNEAGTTCTRLGTFRNGQGWTTFGAEPELFSFPSGERTEFAWRFPVSITPPPPGNALLPLRAWLNLRYRATDAFGNDEGQVISRVGGVIPTPTTDGGWVVDEFVREPFQVPETMELQICIEWGTDQYLVVGIQEDQPVFEADPRETVTILASWQPSIGGVLAGAGAALQRPGTDGLATVADGPVELVSPLTPAGSLSVQAFPVTLPTTAEVNTNAIYPGTTPGRTTVTFDLISPTAGFEPVVRCQTPVGAPQFTLPYAVLPGVPLPFVLNFSSPALPPNADLDDFACEQVSIRGALGRPPQAMVITSVEDILYNRDNRQFEVLVGLYNPTAQPISLAGWSLSAGLYVGSKIAGFQDESVDTVTLAPGEYRREVVRQQSALTGFDLAAIDSAFSRVTGMGTLRVIAGLFRRIDVN